MFNENVSLVILGFVIERIRVAYQASVVLIAISLMQWNCVFNTWNNNKEKGIALLFPCICLGQSPSSRDNNCMTNVCLIVCLLVFLILFLPLLFYLSCVLSFCSSPVFSSFLHQFFFFFSGFVVEIEYVSDSKVLNGTSPALYPPAHTSLLNLFERWYFVQWR